jgi:hypothetical protein
VAIDADTAIAVAKRVHGATGIRQLGALHHVVARVDDAALVGELGRHIVLRKRAQGGQQQAPQQQFHADYHVHEPLLPCYPILFETRFATG